MKNEKEKCFKCTVIAKVERNRITGKKSGISDSAENILIADITEEKKYDETVISHEIAEQIIEEQKKLKG